MTVRNIRQNPVFAFARNAIGIPVAAGVLWPTFALLLSPVVAALGMSLSSANQGLVPHLATVAIFEAS